MSLTQSQVELVDKLYRDASLNLLTPPALNKYLKDNGYTGFTIDKIKITSIHYKQHKLANHNTLRSHM